MILIIDNTKNLKDAYMTPKLMSFLLIAQCPIKIKPKNTFFGQSVNKSWSNCKEQDSINLLKGDTNLKQRQIIKS